MASKSQVFKLDSELTDADFEEARKMIGVPLRLQQFNVEATLDTIRHYAYGIGDDNPLWCDEEYGRSSSYGSVVAPPTWFYSVFAGVSPGFPGLQAFHGTSSWDVVRAARPGERVVASAKLIDIEDVEGRRAGRMAVEVGQATYATTEGEVLATLTTKVIRVPRPSVEGGLRHEPRERQTYSEEEIERIQEEVVSHERRGKAPLRWEDVNEGDQLPTIVKGPLNVETMLAYYSGNLQTGYSSVDMAFKRRHAAFTATETLPNNRATEWFKETTWAGAGHHDSNVAAAVGMPGAYDNGWQRTGWMGQAVTDWAGDDAQLRRLKVRTGEPNIIGDTIWCRGRVTAKRVEGGASLVDVELDAERQDGVTSCTGSATVALPTPGAER